jgi:[CysO sulfur-carrier protein]-S-L-cysteine hydrolase
MTRLESCPTAPTLEIPEDLLSQVIAHCLRESPLECCGLLGGVSPRATSVHPLRNLAASETRYTADPKELVEAWRWLREHQAQILAIYHSHPRWEAVPSHTDLKENYWGDTPRIIVSLLTDPPVVRVWRLDADSFRELEWVLSP